MPVSPLSGVRRFDRSGEEEVPVLFSTVGFTDNLLEFKRSKTTVSKAQADQSTSLHRLGLRRMRLGVGSQCGFTCDVEGDEEDKADRGKEEEEEGEEEAGGAEELS